MSQSYPALSIIFPVYNERESIEPVMKEWSDHLKKLGLTYQIIICEDGSTDGTPEFVRSIAKKYNILFDHQDFRRGYGGAVLDGIRLAKTPYILCVDSDGQCDPKDLQTFLDHREDADVLIGWRTKRADATQRLVFSGLFRMLFQSLFPTAIHDPSAPYVLFKKTTVLPYLKYFTYLKEGFWWGFIASCTKVGLTVKEFPVNHRDRFMGDTQVYHLKKIPSIAFRNALGLIRLKLAQ
jgi:glycosyltransferase involved in cell wall biosynthesis